MLILQLRLVSGIILYNASISQTPERNDATYRSVWAERAVPAVSSPAGAWRAFLLDLRDPIGAHFL